MFEKTHEKHGGFTEDMHDLMENVSESMKKQIWHQKLKKRVPLKSPNSNSFNDEAGEIAQWIKHLSPKYDELSLDTQNLYKARNCSTHLQSQHIYEEMGNRDETILQSSHVS